MTVERASDVLVELSRVLLLFSNTRGTTGAADRQGYYGTRIERRIVRVHRRPFDPNRLAIREDDVEHERLTAGLLRSWRRVATDPTELRPHLGSAQLLTGQARDQVPLTAFCCARCSLQAIVNILNIRRQLRDPKERSGNVALLRGCNRAFPAFAHVTPLVDGLQHSLGDAFYVMDAMPTGTSPTQAT